MRAKAISSKSVIEHHARGEAGPSRPDASSTAPAAPPSFDPTPLNELKAILDGSKFVNLATQLIQGLETRLTRLAELLKASNWAEAAPGAHDIVSVAGNVGAARLSALARELEHLCKAGDSTRCRPAASALQNEAVEALHALKNYQSAL